MWRNCLRMAATLFTALLGRAVTLGASFGKLAAPHFTGKVAISRVGRQMGWAKANRCSENPRQTLVPVVAMLRCDESAVGFTLPRALFGKGAGFVLVFKRIGCIASPEIRSQPVKIFCE
jgi:hypothetical protein